MGEEHTADWAKSHDLPFREDGSDNAHSCQEDWHRHIVHVRDTAPSRCLPSRKHCSNPSPPRSTNSAGNSPTAALKTARSLEIIAQRTAYWPAQRARTQDHAATATALGVNTDEARNSWLGSRDGAWTAAAETSATCSLAVAALEGRQLGEPRAR
ncbi:hypothetical protein GCM10010347_63100 [Streptomyces cirratus]|uniref:Uncharacterized protein n=1 Tax=Streptomyces cirratus TaxID=68187 RepID=A0ABQ3F1Z7_9ACTN|nr:hypothetical protein GCM10010347_63100 [Streptomyces cirratus]